MLNADKFVSQLTHMLQDLLPNNQVDKLKKIATTELNIELSDINYKNKV